MPPSPPAETRASTFAAVSCRATKVSEMRDAGLYRGRQQSPKRVCDSVTCGFTVRDKLGLRQPAFCRTATSVVPPAPGRSHGSGAVVEGPHYHHPGFCFWGEPRHGWHCGCGGFPLQVSPARTRASPALLCAWLLRPADEIVEPESGWS